MTRVVPSPAARFIRGRTKAACALAMLVPVLLCPNALAQYKWVDDDGRVVYSDRPPAQARPGVMVMRGAVAIPLETAKAQGGISAPGTPVQEKSPTTVSEKSPPPANEKVGTETAAAPASAARGETAPQSLADRQLALRRRQTEAQEQERLQAAQSRQRLEQQAQCDGRRTDLRTLEAGGRISQVDASGERVVMGEEEMARRIDSLRRQIAQDCSGR